MLLGGGDLFSGRSVALPFSRQHFRCVSSQARPPNGTAARVLAHITRRFDEKLVLVAGDVHQFATLRRRPLQVVGTSSCNILQPLWADLLQELSSRGRADHKERR